MRLEGLIALTLVALPQVALAYPIPPQTLRMLTEESAIVAVAETKSIDLVKGEGAYANLKILETWRGPSHDTLRVPFSIGMICPAPPRFVEGEMVLVFLARDTDGEGYHVQGLSYGTLYPHFDELEIYEEAVRSFDPNATKAVETSWLVRLAARRATRWHGLYELSIESDPRHRYYDSNEPTKYALSPDDLQVLARGIVNEPTADQDLLFALRLLAGFVDPRLDRLGVAALDELMHEREPPYYFDALMEVVMKRLGREVTFPAPEPKGELDDPLLGMPVHRATWAFEQWPKLRATIDVDTKGVEFVLRLPRVLGTGADTPL